MRSTAEGQRQRINELGLSENVWAAWRTAYGKFPIDAIASPVLYCFYIIAGDKERQETLMVRFAVIGTNIITDTFLEAAKEVEGFVLRGVYSRAMERARAYAARHGAELTFDSLEELAACEEIDAVYIASPNSLHAAQTIRMLKAGKHVLCEKTIASNLREFEEMKRTAEEHQTVLLEAMRSVHAPGFRAIRENLKKLGAIRRISFQFCKYSSRYDNYKKGVIENAFNPAFSNGALMDIGVYCVHPAVALFGMPKQIKSSALKLSNGVDGAGTILLEYGEMQGELVYSKISDSRVASQIQGEDGTMVIGEIQNPQDVVIYYRTGETEKLSIPQTDRDMCYEIRDFLELIAKKNVRHPWLSYSGMELELMDEVRRQQDIIFPADRAE